MAAAPVNHAKAAPFAVPSGQSNKDTTAAIGGNQVVVVKIDLEGTAAQIAADYATLAAVSLTSSSRINFGK